jgi:hypothetical protein
MLRSAPPLDEDLHTSMKALSAFDSPMGSDVRDNSESALSRCGS